MPRQALFRGLREVEGQSSEGMEDGGMVTLPRRSPAVSGTGQRTQRTQRTARSRQCEARQFRELRHKGRSSHQSTNWGQPLLPAGRTNQKLLG